MARILKSFWLQEEYTKVITRRAKELMRSEAFIVEMCLHEMFKNELPLDVVPGRRLKNTEAEK